MTIRRVERIGLDGTCISVTIGRTTIPFRKTSYGDKLETDAGSDMGSQQIDYRTRGTYTTDEFDGEIEEVNFREILQPLLKTDGFGNEHLPIVVSETHPQLGYDSDLLENFRFGAISNTYQNDNKVLVRSVKGTFDQLYLGEDRKTINQFDLTVPLGAPNF